MEVLQTFLKEAGIVKQGDSEDRVGSFRKLPGLRNQPQNVSIEAKAATLGLPSRGRCCVRPGI